MRTWLASDWQLCTDEYVVFITPTKLQLSIFEKILSHDKLDNLVRNSTAESLALINMLTKISNSPILLKATADQAKLKAQQGGDSVKRNAIEEALTLLPERAQVEDVSLSGQSDTRHQHDPRTLYADHWAGTGKLSALARLLKALQKVCVDMGSVDCLVWCLRVVYSIPRRNVS